ncbi:MAG: oligosaccharide flippase family protein [Armatimonadota bacterium]
MSRLLNNHVTRNVLSLYGVQFARFILPLATVPYLARVLGPSVWGLVVFAQSFALWMILLIEYGFLFSATREIARCDNDHQYISKVAAGVLGAKTILSVLTLIISFIVLVSAPAFKAHPEYLVWSLMYIVATGFSPLWYFQGIQKLTIPALIDIAGRFIASAGVFIWVKSPDNGHICLALQGIGSVVSTGILFILMYKKVEFSIPSISDSLAAIKKGWQLFLFRSSASLFSAANGFILGLFAPPVIVGYYGGADNINKAGNGMFQPLSQAIYPHINQLMLKDPMRAKRFARISLILQCAVGFILSSIIIIFAPVIIHILMGPQYMPAVQVVRVLALQLMVTGASRALGIQWLLPLGMDREFTYIFVCAGIFNIVMACILAPLFGAVGMAAAVVLTEASIVVAMLAVLIKTGNTFFKD